MYNHIDENHVRDHVDLTGLKEIRQKYCKYKCSVCNKLETSKWDLLLHMRESHEDYLKVEIAATPNKRKIESVQNIVNEHEKVQLKTIFESHTGKHIGANICGGENMLPVSQSYYLYSLQNLTYDIFKQGYISLNIGNSSVAYTFP